MSSLLSIFIGAVSLFLIVRLVFLSITRKRIQGALGQRPGRIAMHAAAGTAANLLFWFALSAGVTLAIVAFVETWQPITLADAESMLGQVREWADRLSTALNSTILFASGAAALALLWYSHRRARKSAEADLTQRMSAALSKLEAQAADGTLPPEEPTENMQIVGTEIAQAQAELETLETQNIEPERQAALSDQIEQLIQLYWQMDLFSRAESQVQADIAREDNHETKRNWFATFFTSNGFHDTLSGVGKALAVLCVLAIIPASLVVTGPLALDRLETKHIALEADHRALSFEIAEGEINQAWATIAPEEAEAETDLTDEDIEVASELGQMFESQHVPSAIIRVAPRAGVRPAARVFQLDRVRTNILSRAAERTSVLDATNTRPAPTSAVARNTNALISGVADSPDRPRTAIGQRVRSDALDLAKRNPSLWSDVKRRVTAYRRSFGVAANPARLQAVIVNQAIGDLLGNVGSPNGFWGEQARSFGSQISASSAESYTKASSRAFMAEIAQNGDFKTAMERSTARTVKALPANDLAALRRVAELPPAPDELARQLRSTRTTLAARTVTMSDSAAARAVRRSASTFRGGMEAAGALVEFADYFPGHQGQELETKRAKAARAADLRGAPPSRSNASGGDLRRSRTAVARAGSYGRLRGFSRIGGVLIGRAAQNQDPVRVDHFDWNHDGRNFWFELAVDGGQRKTFGPVDAAIVHLALVYAADGRPTTVTMVTAPPMAELRILTHPAIIDTGLGCRARRLDQFADEATNMIDDLKALRQSERSNAISEVALYNLARDLRLVAVAETQHGQSRLAAMKATELVDVARSGLDHQQTLANAALRLEAPARPLRIADKQAFFDKHLVQDIENCRQTGDLDGFAQCIIKSSRDNAWAILDRNSEWLAPRIEFQTWSGVRERDFAIDSTLSFLGNGSETPLGPLRFMVQLAISSPAFFAASDKPWYDPDNTAPDEFIDLDPWEFDRTGPRLDDAIAGLLQNSREHAEIFSDMADFTRMQRLFRMALDGAMSESFPIEALPEIAEATAAALNPDAPTLRWNVRSGQIEADVEATLSSAPAQDDKIKACLTLAGRYDAAEVPTSNWDAVCSPSVLGASLDPQLVADVEYLSASRAMRFELNVQRDDILAKSYRVSGCPKL